MSQILFLADFSVIKPDPGLIFWTALVFITLWFFLGRMAFRPIQNALKKRETDIQSSLDEAKRVRDEMSKLKADNEALLKLAQEERVKILREASETKEAIISEARAKAKEESRRIVEEAKELIEHQKMAAIIDVKNQVGNMAIDLTERLLRANLKGNAEQEQLVGRLMDEMKLN
ncbi:MAG: F0F1 ATP synthase subunit B [Saprospiraceae bacterium]|nr:F0F1 ATP synthase subunit B [Saprospiraceae bacterium]